VTYFRCTIWTTTFSWRWNTSSNYSHRTLCCHLVLVRQEPWTVCVLGETI